MNRSNFHKSLIISSSQREKLSQFLDEVESSISNSTSKVTGLLPGKIGQAIFYGYLWKETNESRYKNKFDQLIDLRV